MKKNKIQKKIKINGSFVGISYIKNNTFEVHFQKSHKTKGQTIVISMDDMKRVLMGFMHVMTADIE